VYRQIRDLVYKVSGIYKAEEKLYLLAQRCPKAEPSLSSCCHLLALLDERQQVGIDLVCVGCWHPVREDWIHL